MWQIYAAIAAAAASHIGTQMSAKNQRAPAYAGDVDLSKTIKQNAIGNTNNMSVYAALTSGINKYSQQQQSSMLEGAMPGYGQWASKQSLTARDYASGVLNQEQLGYLTQKSYEGSMASGIRGQAAQYAAARNIGLEQFNRAQYSSSIIRDLANLGKAQQTDMGSFYSTGQQALNTALSNRAANQSYMNAQQASQNVQKNAIWAAIASAGAGYAQWKSGGKPLSGDQTYYKDVNTAYANNIY